MKSWQLTLSLVGGVSAIVIYYRAKAKALAFRIKLREYALIGAGGIAVLVTFKLTSTYYNTVGRIERSLRS